MAQKIVESDQDALRSWYKRKLGEVVQEMLKIGAVSGVAVESTPVWAAMNQVLIAKVWASHEKSKFIWTISGESVVTDHVAGSVANTPQEAARHFSLKWQMDADRLGIVAQGSSMIENSGMHMGAYTEKLIQSAELLYEMTTDDEAWKPRKH